MMDQGCNYHPYMDERVSRIEQKTNEIETRVFALEIHKSETVIKLDQIIEIIGELKVKMDKLSEKPIKRMDMLATAFASSGVALVLGYVFAQAMK